MLDQRGHFADAFVNVEMCWRHRFKYSFGTSHLLNGAVCDDQKSVRFEGFLILDNAVFP